MIRNSITDISTIMKAQEEDMKTRMDRNELQVKLMLSSSTVHVQTSSHLCNDCCSNCRLGKRMFESLGAFLSTFSASLHRRGRQEAHNSFFVPRLVVEIEVISHFSITKSSSKVYSVYRIPRRVYFP